VSLKGFGYLPYLIISLLSFFPGVGDHNLASTLFVESP
jgi:hypothetical protein